MLYAALLLTAVVPAPAQPVLVMGDSRDDVSGVLPEIVAQAGRIPGLAFAIYLGDMTSAARPDEFAHYRQVVGKLKIPLFAVPGNHDRGRAASYEKEVGPAYYSHQLGRWRFIFIDNSTESLGSIQLDWVKTELEDASARRDWIVLAIHKPIWCPGGGGHVMEEPGKQVLLDLVRRYHVRLVLGAHVHDYFKYVHDGVTHVTTGGAGAPLTGLGAYYHYVVADFHDDGRFDIRVVRVNPGGHSGAMLPSALQRIVSEAGRLVRSARPN